MESVKFSRQPSCLKLLLSEASSLIMLGSFCSIYVIFLTYLEYEMQKHRVCCI